MTTALRYITVLEERGMISRRSSPFDARMHYLQLTDEAFSDVREALIVFARIRHGPSPAVQDPASVFRFDE
jgi:DNA-binding MarR family transcriptional regulator